jgi:hypothetical protein
MNIQLIVSFRIPILLLYIQRTKLLDFILRIYFLLYLFLVIYPCDIFNNLIKIIKYFDTSAFPPTSLLLKLVDAVQNILVKLFPLSFAQRWKIVLTRLLIFNIILSLFSFTTLLIIVLSLSIFLSDPFARNGATRATSFF